MDHMRVQFWGAVKWFVALLVAQLASLNYAFQVLALFMLIDMGSGVALYIYRKELSSSRFGLGLAKKFGIIAMVAIAHPLEEILTMQASVIVGHDVMIEIALERWLSIAYIFGESISIIENAHGLGAPIPAVLVAMLLKAKKTIRMADTAQIKTLRDDGSDVAEPAAKE